MVAQNAYDIAMNIRCQEEPLKSILNEIYEESKKGSMFYYARKVLRTDAFYLVDMLHRLGYEVNPSEIDDTYCELEINWNVYGKRS